MVYCVVLIANMSSECMPLLEKSIDVAGPAMWPECLFCAVRISVYDAIVSTETKGTPEYLVIVLVLCIIEDYPLLRDP